MKGEEEAIIVSLALEVAVISTLVDELTEFVAVDADRAVETRV